MTPPKSKVRPHLFQPDPDIPAAVDGRGACLRCHLVGKAGDTRHTLPAAPVEADHGQLAAGERGQG